jgi:membrane fusion protein, multidrug efflux system
MTEHNKKNSIPAEPVPRVKIQEPNPIHSAKIPWFKTGKAKKTGIVILMITIVCFLIWFFVYRPYVSTDDARISATIIRVANRGASGLIQKVHVTEGSVVSQGDILVELDSRPAEAMYDKAKARAKLTTLERKRMETLAAQQGTSQQQLDKVRSDAAIADAECRIALLALEFTSLKCPVDGIVIQKPADEGNILESNQTALTIADTEHAWVSANIAETEVERVAPGQKVSISIDEGGELAGHVTEVRKSAASTFSLIPSDNASGNFTKVVQRIPIKVAIDPHPRRSLRVGQSVVIRIRVR